MMERILIVVGALFAIAQAGPIQLSQNLQTCATTCTDSNKFGYRPGSTYTYHYDSNIKTEVQGTSTELASIQLTATVQLEIISKCELSMRLGDVQLKEYDPGKSIMTDVLSDFKAGLERNPIRLSFQDGNVEHLCLTGEEPTWVLNAKRGIISLIQNNMEDFKTNHTTSETDVTGVCNTEYYTREKGYYTTTVGKTKNLLGCTERHGYNTAVQAVPYTAESNIQSLPLLKSDHNCIHEIYNTEGYLKSVTCQEEHVFRPFSNSDSGAVTSNKQTLTFIRVSSGIKRPATIENTASLKFDHINDVDKENKDRKDLTRKLLEICEKTKAGVRPETPKLFTDLVYIMKTADSSAISGIYQMLKDKKICSDNLYRTTKYFLDALPIAGTSASLRLMTELITSNSVSGLEADMWLTSLAFIKNPTVDMLKSVKPLINMPTNSEKAMLSVGTLVHSYCIQNGDCDNNEMVKAIISTFVNKMATGCKVKDNNFQSTLMALRGIGNAGFAKSAIPKLEVCMRVKQNPIEIRLSAIEAFRRMPCDSRRKTLVSILEDTNEDSEIRIAAYKVLMECPSEKTMTAVRRTLASEEVNQVGSYIWTHLTNLMETSDRHKQDLKSLLEDETFKKEFDLDKRKFSRNYEGSVFIDQINAGAKVEGDLIWSSKSFIPRSGMMNLTFDLFGHSVNLFEMGGRAEGLEYFFESFFGPNGYFQAPEPESDSNELLPNNIDSGKMNKIDKRFSAQESDLRASMYMRVFGNELRYMNFRGMDSLLSGPDFNVLDMLIKLAEDNDYTYSHSTMFLDSSFIVPTGSGFPLNLTVNGTATIDLTLKGKMDLRHPPSININGRIQPSAAVDITSMMSVDAFVTKSGVKMVSTLHTSTAVQGALKIDDKGSITSEYEMPEPKMEIIDVRSSFFTIHRDTEREQKLTKENRKFVDYCSPSKLVTITGLELCAEVSYPLTDNADAPYFPLTGPASAGLYLYKRDTHTKYTFAAKSIHNKDKNIVKVTIDTPGSREDRLIDIDFSLDRKDLSLGMSLKSPWKRADVSGSVSTDRKKSGVSGVMKIDGQYPYAFNAMLMKQRSGNKYTWTPSLSIDMSTNKKISLTVTLSNDNWKQFEVSYEAEGISLMPPTAKVTVTAKQNLVGIQGSVDIKKDKQYSVILQLGSTKYPKKIMYEPLASIRTPEKEMLSFGGTFGRYFGRGVDARLVLDIVGQKQTTLKGKFLTKKMANQRNIYNTKLDFRSGPADFSVTGKIDNKKFRSIGTNFDITYVIRKISRNNIKIVSKVTNLSASALTKGKGNMIVQFKRNPEYNFKVMSEIDHNNKHTEIDSVLWFGPDFKDATKRIDYGFEMNRNWPKNSVDFNTRFKFPYKKMSMVAKGAHSHDSKNVDSNLYVKFGKNQPIETSLQFHDKTGKKVSVTSDLKFTSDSTKLGIGLDIDQPDDNAYVSSLRMFSNKKQNTITTTIKPEEDGSIGMDSEIKLFNRSAVKLHGEFRLNPSDFKTYLSYEKDARKYAASLTSATEVGKLSWINADLLHPDRRLIFSVQGKTINNVLHGSADINWNADISNVDRIAISGWMEPPSMAKLNGSVSFEYASTKLILNAYHLRTAKYITHADFQWAPAKKIISDVVFGLNKQSFNGNVKISTPFTELPKLNVGLTYGDNSEEYNTQTTVTWGKTDTIALQGYVKKPITLNTFVGSLGVKSSNKNMKNIKLVVDHKLKSSLSSSVDFKWNRQSIKADIDVQNKTKGMRLGYEGTLNLQTTYRVIKKARLNVAFDTNWKTFNSAINLKRNAKLYSMVSTMTHNSDLNGLANDGSVTIKSPSETYTTRWEHRHNAISVDTSLTSTRGKRTLIIATLKTTFDDAFDATVNIQTPFNYMKSASLESKYHKQNKRLESKLTSYLNGKLIGLTEANYNLDEEISTAAFDLTVPSLSLNSKVNAELTMKESNGISARMNAAITPSISLNIEALSHNTEDGTSATTELLWKSSIPGYEQAKYTYKIESGNDLTSTTTLEYDTDKSIIFDTKFSLTMTNSHASATLRTPFDSIPYSQVGVNTQVQGDLDSFKSDAFIEIQNVLDRRSVGLAWKTIDGFESKLSFVVPSGQSYSLTTMFNNDKQIIGKATLSVPGRRDISLVLTHDSTQNGISSVFEVQHNRKNTLNFNLNVDTNNKLKISAGGNMRFEVLSPTEQYTISYDFEHTPSAFNTYAEFSTKSGGPSFVKIIADYENGLDSNIIIKSPFIKNIKASFNHDYSNNNLRSSADVIYGGKNVVDLQANLNTKDSVFGNLMIKSPILEDISLMTRLDGHTDNFVLRTEGTYGKSNIELELKSAIGSYMLQQKLSVKALEKEFSIEINHNGGLDLFKTFGECNIGLDRHRVDVSFTTVNDIEGNIMTESSLMAPVSASLLLKGNPADFKTRVECNIDTDRSSLDMSFKLSPKIGGEINIKSPYTNDIFLNMNHVFDGSKLDTSAHVAIENFDDIDVSLQANGNTVHAQYTIGILKSELDASLGISNPYSGQITLKSHLFPELSVGFEHTGTLQDFHSHAEFTKDSDKSDIYMSFSGIKGITGSLEVQSYLMPSLSVKLTNYGTLLNSDSHGEIVLGSEKREANMKINFEDKIDVKVDYICPEYGTTTANFRHSGVPTNFKSHVELGRPNNKWEGDVSMVAENGQMNFEASVQNPEEWRDGNFNFKLSGIPSDISMESDLVFGFDNMATGLTYQLTSSSLKSAFTFKSSLTTDFSADVEAKTESSGFSSKIRVAKGEDESTGSLSVSKSGEHTGTASLEIRSPYTTGVSVFAEHDGVPTKFFTKYNAMIGNKNFNGEMNLNVKDKMEGGFKLNRPNVAFETSITETDIIMTATKDEESYTVYFKLPSLSFDNIMLEGKLTTPIEGYRHIKATYNHQGSLRNIQCNGILSLEGVDSTLEFKLDTRNLKNIDGILEITSPYLPKTSIKLSHSIGAQNYLFTADVTADGEKLYGYKVIYNGGSDPQGKIELNVDGTVLNVIDFLVSESQFDVSSGMSQIKGSLTSDSKKQGSLSVISPYIPSTAMNFEVTGEGLDFEGNAELLVDGERSISVESSLKSADKTTAAFSVELLQEKYSGQFSLVPGDRNLQIIASMSNWQLPILDTKFVYNSNNKLLVDFSLKSSIVHDQSWMFYLSSSEASVNSEFDITIENMNILNGKCDYTVSPINLQGNGKVMLGGLKTSVGIIANEEEKMLQIDAGVETEDGIWSLNSKYEGKKDVDASFSITRPDQEDIKGMFVQDSRRFKSGTTARLQLNSTHFIEIETNQSWKKEYVGITSIKTPFKGFELSSLELKHMGKMPNVKSSAVMLLAGEEYSVSVGASNKNSMKADIAIKSPFDLFKDIELTVHCDGDLSNFKTGGELAYATGKAIVLEVEHSLVGFDLHSKIRFMSPYTDEIILSTNHTGTPTAFTSSYKLAMGEDNSLTSYTSMNMGHAFLSLSTELQTKLSGENFNQKLEIKHDGALDNFKTEVNVDVLGYRHSLDSSFTLEPVMEGSFGIMTPYENFKNVKIDFSHKLGASGILSKCEIEYAPGQIIKGKVEARNYNWKRMESTIELNTPFTNMETNKVEYVHTYETGRIECQLDSTVFSKDVKANLKASNNPLSINFDMNTPVKGFENIGFHGNYLASPAQISSRIEAKWNMESKITVDSSCTIQGPIEARISFTSPFKPVEEVSVIFEHNDRSNGFKESAKVTHNNNVLVDGAFDIIMSSKHSFATIDVRSPWPMKFETEGDFDKDNARVGIYADWNTNDRYSNMKIDGVYDLTTKKSFNVKVTQPLLFRGVIALRGELGDKSCNGALVLGDEMYGYDVLMGEYGGSLKVILPARSLELSGSQRGRVTEGSFMWDADVDQTKKIAIKHNVYSSRNLVKSDVSISLPSFGKNVQLGSKIALNQGRVLFSGTTELSYSGDSRKKIMLMSKVEDISSYGNQNYSFSFGVSHPYSTVDIKVNSHVGKSSDKYSAGVGLEYLTARSQSKKFQIGGSIDQIKKTISFELLSPVKTISISGSAQTGDKFRLSLLNAYDQKRPLYSYFTVDPSTRSVDFSMNYDLENPENALRMSAKYVNSSAVSAEVYHTMQGGSKVTDILTTARLNTSHLLHSRIHWRPEIIQDLKSFINNKKMDYTIRLFESEKSVRESLVQELNGKLWKIQNAVEDQIGNENMAVLKPVFQAIRDSYNHMREMPVQETLPISQNYPEYVLPKYELQAQAVEIIPSLRYIVSNSFGSVRGGIEMMKTEIPQYANSALMNVTAFQRLTRSAIYKVLEASVKEYLTVTEAKVLNELDDVERVILSYLKSPFTVYDPEHGEIQLEIPTIISIQSLDKIPTIDPALYTINFDEINNYLPEMPDVSAPELPNEWLAPFTGVATVSKGHHITTYDGYVYDLNVDCTYILSRDYLDGNFSFILSNDGDTTLTVLTSGKPISINVQGQILLGGEEKEAPFTDGFVTVSKVSDELVNIKGGDHFNIDYDTSVDHIDISVSGWYHGKTGGLLGIYDNEPSNDLMTSFGKVISDSSRVAKTWTVGVNSC